MEGGNSQIGVAGFEDVVVYFVSDLSWELFERKGLDRLTEKIVRFSNMQHQQARLRLTHNEQAVAGAFLLLLATIPSTVAGAFLFLLAKVPSQHRSSAMLLSLLSAFCFEKILS